MGRCSVMQVFAVVFLIGTVAAITYATGNAPPASDDAVPRAYASAGEEYEPPKKQAVKKAPDDIICNSWHVLAIRANQMPVCITPETAKVLQDRGVIHRILGPTAAYEKSAEIRVEDTSANRVDVASNVTITDLMRENSTGDHNSDKPGSDHKESGNDHKESASRQAVNTYPGRVGMIPASSSSIVNLYITDHDLNLAPNAPETVPVEGLLRFYINDTPIAGPSTMIETGPDTGQFYVRLVLPATIDGRPLSQDDTVNVTYMDQTDRTGQRHETTSSFVLSSTYAQMHSEGEGNKRIGHPFTLRLYDPDANTDSKEENRIPLNRLGFKGEGNTRATLDHRAFDANRSHMVETGPNTGIFEVTIKIPRQIDGRVIHIGDRYEITYHDHSTPSGTTEEIVLKGRIGLYGR